MFCAKFGWNLPSGSGKDFKKKFSMYFCYFVRISPWKRAWPFIWINLNPHYQRKFCVKFGWTWPVGSGGFVSIFSLFRKYIPLEKAWPFICKKIESPSPKDALCQVLLKLPQWFWRFLNFVSIFSLFLKTSPLKWAWPLIWFFFGNISKYLILKIHEISRTSMVYIVWF